MEKAQARGLLKVSAAGTAASNNCPLAPRIAESVERPSTVPSAHKARPWLSSDPTFPSASAGHS